MTTKGVSDLDLESVEALLKDDKRESDKRKKRNKEQPLGRNDDENKIPDRIKEKSVDNDSNIGSEKIKKKTSKDRKGDDKEQPRNVSKGNEKSRSKSKDKDKKYHKKRKSSKSHSRRHSKRNDKKSKSKSSLKNEPIVDPIKEQEKLIEKENEIKMKAEEERMRMEKEQEEKQRKDLRAIELQIEEAKRQAEEARRDDLTVLILQLPIKADEHHIYQFFKEGKCGKIRDIRIIKDPRSGKSKGIAYVEFYSQESVVSAISLSGKEMLGFQLKIQPSQAEKNRAAAAAKQLRQPKQVDSQNTSSGPMRIYVGGLTDSLADIQEQDLRDLFSPFGEIEFVDIHRDSTTGKCKGYAFIQYKNASDAKAAINKMNGFPINNRAIKVSHVQGNLVANEGYGIDLDEDSNNSFLHSAQSRALLMQKLSRGGPGFSNQSLPQAPQMPNQQLIRPENISNIGNVTVSQDSISKLGLGISTIGSFPPIQPNLNQLSTNTNRPQISTNPTSCILLTNMFSVGKTYEPSYFVDLRDEVLDEAKAYGEVEKIVVEQDSDGNIWIKYKDMQNAVESQKGFNSKFFSGVKVNCVFVSEMQFASKFT